VSVPIVLPDGADAGADIAFPFVPPAAAPAWRAARPGAPPPSVLRI
jgi:hypothetical protein